MNPEDVKQLVDVLLKSAEILGSKAFELALRQVYVQAFQSLGWTVFFGTVLSLMPRLRRYADDDEELLVAISWVLSIISVLCILVNITEFAGTMINPQWYAIELLLETVTGS